MRQLLLDGMPRNRLMKLAVSLSTDEADPHLVWASCFKASLPKSSATYNRSVVEHLLGDSITHEVERFNFAKNEIRRYELDHTVILYAEDNLLNNGSKSNQAALSMTGWEIRYDWRGNILIVSHKRRVGVDILAQIS
jgi:hypothetical protein